MCVFKVFLCIHTFSNNFSSILRSRMIKVTETHASSPSPINLFNKKKFLAVNPFLFGFLYYQKKLENYLLSNWGVISLIKSIVIKILESTDVLMQCKNFSVVWVCMKNRTPFHF